MRYIAILFLLLTTSCNAPPNKQVNLPSPSPAIKIIEGCEYFVIEIGTALNCPGTRYCKRLYSLVHKGNCKNPIHSENQRK